MKDKMYMRSIILKVIILAAVVYGVLMSTDDPNTFTKFTTLSNIGVGVAMLLFIATEFAGIRCGRDLRAQWMYVFKFMMTIGVLITFVMYMTMIAPKSSQGLFGSYANHHYGSLMLHFVSPILVVVDFYKFDSGYQPKPMHAVFSILPPLAYVGMIVVLAQNGYRWAHGMLAPYAFLNFGAPTGWWGWDLGTASVTSVGIGTGYMTIFLSAIFVLIGIVMLMIKRKK